MSTRPSEYGLHRASLASKQCRSGERERDPHHLKVPEIRSLVKVEPRCGDPSSDHDALRGRVRVLRVPILVRGIYQARAEAALGVSRKCKTFLMAAQPHRADLFCRSRNRRDGPIPEMSLK